MILVDASVWIDHLRHGSAALGEMLGRRLVLCHPWVVGEIALGSLARRHEVITLMRGLPQAPVAGPDEVLAMIEAEQLHGQGIGWVDAQLLAAARLAGSTGILTRDRRLRTAAERLAIAASG